MKQTELKKQLNTESIRYFKIADINTHLIIENVRELLENEGATILYNKAPYIWEIEARTGETNPEKIAKIKALPHYYFRSISNYFIWSPTLQFILDGYYYYISYDENPFFPITYQKIKINDNGEYIGKRYLYSSEALNDREWKKHQSIAFTIAYDNIFKICNDNEINEMAQAHCESIKTWIINGPEAATISERKRVSNYYNASYHYENIFDKSICKVLGA